MYLCLSICLNGETLHTMPPRIPEYRCNLRILRRLRISYHYVHATDVYQAIRLSQSLLFLLLFQQQEESFDRISPWLLPCYRLAIQELGGAKNQEKID